MAIIYLFVSFTGFVFCVVVFLCCRSFLCSGSLSNILSWQCPYENW